MKITTNRFAGILIAVMVAGTFLSLTGVSSGNASLYMAGFALFIAVVPLVVLQTWFSQRAVESSQERDSLD